MTDPRVPTPDERWEALRRAWELLYAQEPSIEDLILVADWLATGNTEPAIESMSQIRRHYTGQHGDTNPDAMRRTPQEAG